MWVLSRLLRERAPRPASPTLSVAASRSSFAGDDRERVVGLIAQLRQASPIPTPNPPPALRLLAGSLRPRTRLASWPLLA